MSLSSQVAALASRIASEFNALRSEVSSNSGATMDSGTSFPENPSIGEMFLVTTERKAYVFTGVSWSLMSQEQELVDGLGAEQEVLFSVMDGFTSVTESSTQVVDGQSA